MIENLPNIYWNKTQSKTLENLGVQFKRQVKFGLF